jgi:uncharacterized protein (TIGR02466 family)
MSDDRAAQAERLRRSVSDNPQDAIAWHNLAAMEGDLGRAEEAERAARRAMTLGLAAPETRLVLARALLALRRLDEADRMFEEALRLRPAYAEAHRDLAQLRWMTSGRPESALRTLDAALQRSPREAGLHLVRSIVLEFTGRPADALESARAAVATAPNSSEVLRQAAHLSAETGDGALALTFAQRAFELAPADSQTRISLCEALLAAGLAREAEGVAAQLHEALPHDQHAIALRATAWRLSGDSRYPELYDYDRLVQRARIEPPPGWSRVEDFLADLRGELEALHAFRMHPFQQSVRGGGQLPLASAEMSRPLVRALFVALQKEVERYLRALGRGADPFSARNSRTASIAGAWSVRLASGGYHTDHVHQRGWLSSAFYVSLPRELPATQGSAKEGWLRLGKPGVATTPALPADHYVRPEEGVLVLFPAYVWHGVEPFQSQSARLTVAFDALPA